MLYCRVTRGVVMSLREQSFIDAARAIGASDRRIVWRHIVPNLITPLLTMAALDVPNNILTESTLSFLGFGIQPPESSWGTMLAQGRGLYPSCLVGGRGAGRRHIPDCAVVQPVRSVDAGGQRPVATVALAEGDQRGQGGPSPVVSALRFGFLIEVILASLVRRHTLGTRKTTMT